MSLHISVLAIEADYLAELPAFFEQADYRVLKTTTVRTSAEAGQLLNDQPDDRNKVVKVAYLQDGWTMLVDPEMVLFADNDLVGGLSKKLHSRILGWVCEGVSGTYGFSFFNNGQIRCKLSVDGKIAEDTGVPIGEEAAIAWDNVFEDDILKLAERLGAPFHYLEEDREYQVFLLDESGMDEAQPSRSVPTVPQPPTPKPKDRPVPSPSSKQWWQFWK